MYVTLAGHHASPHRYDFPNYQAITERRQHHANGNLGLFIATGDHHWIRGFGANIYRVEVADEVRDVTVPELRRKGRLPARCRERRRIRHGHRGRLRCHQVV